MSYIVRIYTLPDHSTHTDTPHDTADEAFGQCFEEPLALPEESTMKCEAPFGFSIFRDGVCMHTYGGAEIGTEI
jgi:hypothetical protein